MKILILLFLKINVCVCVCLRSTTVKEKKMNVKRIIKQNYIKKMLRFVE